jgi:hypothetical protein
MSRWADAFAALSEAADTLDTMRHYSDPPVKVSQSVHSVTVPAQSAQARARAHREVRNLGEAETERAAIVENDGGIPRAWTEGFAQLDPNRPPSDVPAKRWLRFIDDVGHFLDSRFCAVATSLGWGPYDLFGCDRDRAFARVDQAGLLWVLNGNRLIALAENTATIETNTGARQIYRRRQSEHGRVLAWDLTRGATR